MFTPSGALGQCRAESVAMDVLLEQEQVAMVFVGMVDRVDREGSADAVTFRAERVWKGPVTQRTTIYAPVSAHSANAGASAAMFERGRRYVVIAHRLSGVERLGLGLPDHEDTFGTDACGDGSRRLGNEPGLRRIGPGHAPVDLQPGVRRPVIVPALRIDAPSPVYPDAARAARVRGTVVVEITVDETGKVSRAVILRSIPKATIDNVVKWEYMPTLIAGVPGPTTLTTTVNFAPEL